MSSVTKRPSISPAPLPNVVHIAHEGILPEWTTGGGGVYITTLAKLQAQNTDRKISIIIPYYVQESGTTESLEEFKRQGKKITFKAEVHDPVSGKEYSTVASCIERVIDGVHVFALRPNKNDAHYFTLGESGTFTSVPSSLSHKVDIDGRLNYFDELAAEFVLNRAKHGTWEGNTVFHTHNYGGAAFKLHKPPLNAALVNMIHSKPLDKPLPPHLAASSPPGMPLKVKAMYEHSAVTASTPQAFISLYQRKPYVRVIEALDGVGSLITARPSIDIEKKHNLDIALPKIRLSVGIDYTTLDIVQKKQLCLKELQAQFKEAGKGWEIDPSKPTVIFIGRLCDLKGIRHLETAIKNAEELGYNMVIMGLPSQSKESTDFVELMQTTYAHIPFLCSKELQAEYGDLVRVSADFGLLLSNEEEFGLVLAEYQAMGAHCIFAEVGGTPYAIAQRSRSPSPEPEPTVKKKEDDLELKNPSEEANELQRKKSGIAAIACENPEPEPSLHKEVVRHPQVEGSSVKQVDVRPEEENLDIQTTARNGRKRSLSFEEEKPRPNPKCGTSFRHGVTDIETQANLSFAMSQKLIEFKNLTHEERVAYQTYILNRAVKDFNPSAWLTRIERAYTHALSQTRTRVEMQEVVLPKLVGTPKATKTPTIDPGSILELPQETQLERSVSTGTIQTAITEALDAIRGVAVYWSGILVEAFVPSDDEEDFELTEQLKGHFRTGTPLPVEVKV